LDEFLGTLTSDAVPDNVVESLARSLAAEFDSPNETLFDSSSANLTDISHSAVPFDFGPNSASSNDLQNVFTSNSTTTDLISTSNDFNQSQYTAASTTTSSYCDSIAAPSQHHHHHHHLGSTTTETTSTDSVAAFTSSTEAHFSQSVKNETQTGIEYTSHIHSESSSLSTLVEKTTTSISSSSAQAGPPQQPQTAHEPAVAPANNSNGPTHVYVTANPEQAQYASLGQLVQAQQNAAVIAGMNQQLALNAQPGASFIIDPTTGQPMMVAGGNTFGTTNLLVAGVQPTYTMLPTQASLFSNAITMQPQIQAIKTTHGTAAGFIQASSAGSSTATATSQTNKGKNPPHLLPKPNNGGTTPNSTASDHGHAEISGGSTSIAGNARGNNVVVTSSAGSITMTTESLSQILQQQQATVSNATAGMSLSQPSFAIGAGGQVVQVSGMQTLNSISGSQIFMNQVMVQQNAVDPGVLYLYMKTNEFAFMHSSGSKCWSQRR